MSDEDAMGTLRDAIQIAIRWADKQQEAKAAEAEAKKLRAQLVELSRGESLTVGPAQVTWANRGGAPKWKDCVEAIMKAHRCDTFQQICDEFGLDFNALVSRETKTPVVKAVKMSQVEAGLYGGGEEF